MCRSVGESGRRCPCDTSEARRLRRHNAQARAAHTAKAPLLTPELVDVSDLDFDVETTVAAEPDYSVGGEKIQQVHDAIANISLMKEAVLSIYSSKRTAPAANFVLPTGERVELNDDGATVLDENGEVLVRGGYGVVAPYLEKTTVHVGAQIQQIVEARADVTDEEILKVEQDGIEELTLLAEKAVADDKAIWAAIYAKHGGSNEMWRTAQSGTPEEKAQIEADQEPGLKSREARFAASRKLSEAAHAGTKKAEELAVKQREVLVETLKEIRSLGGEVIVADNSHKKVLNGFKDAISVYPTAWIEESNNRKPIRVKYTARRAHYSDSKYQNAAKVVVSRNSVLKPEGWEPDPNTRDGLGDWQPMNHNNTWVDPDTGMTYEHYTSPGQQGWMRPELEFAPIYSYTPDSPPRGKGWVKAEIDQEKYSYQTREFHKTGEKETVWYRPVRKRVSIESESQPELTVSGDTPKEQRRVALHEFAHRMQASGETGNYIQIMEQQFLKRRTTIPGTDEREPLQTIYKGTKEKGRPDNFVSLYMGKEYTDKYTEILSTGAEAVFQGSYGGLAGLGRLKADRDMKSFIIGLWATA